MASVKIENVRKSYGALETIKGVSVDIEDGNFVVLVGPSGCGKSTLLRMIAGLEEISGGTISIDDRVINDVEPKERDIAMVFQNYALYPHMTIAENMGFSLRLAKRSKDEINTRVQDAARILGLTDYLDRFPKQLSGGQRQRVAMGRAIVRNPKVFLFDEPLSNLDAQLRVQMRAELKDLHSRLKTTTIYVTHDQIEAMTMADKIVVMRAGIVEQAGSPLELYDFPVNRFVASFIGSPSMNFIKGNVAEDGKSVKTATGEIVQLGKSIAIRGSVEIGIRPEHLEVGTSEFSMSIQVYNIEPTGAETYVQGKLGDQNLAAQLRQRIHLDRGSDLTLRYDPANLHLFDAETGNRIE